VSRSLKTGSDNPGSEKAGSRDRPRLRPRSKRQDSALACRRMFGSTEKILRRNRKLWTRLYAKEGRRLDKVAVQESRSD